MNREGAPGKSPEEMYIQQKVRVLLMLRKMGSNVSAFRVPSHGSPREGAEQRAAATSCDSPALGRGVLALWFGQFMSLRALPVHSGGTAGVVFPSLC